MINFEYCSPTKIIFGKDTHKNVGKELKIYTDKVLLHYGGKSIKESGVYDDVISSLKKENIKYVELGGVKANPRIELVYEGIKLCKEENIEFILAIGGGSVIDSAKAIAVGVKYIGDVWELYTDKTKEANDSIKIATILTIPAAGSEISGSSVISKESTQEKQSYGCELMKPVFSILNPELCYTLPKYQLACGVSDILAHMMERYFTNTASVDYTDRVLEASMKSLINTSVNLIDNIRDYDSWSNVMWTGTMAHSNILGVGRAQDWASHQTEHQLSAIYDIAHGAGLSIVFPAWMKYVYKENINRFIQFSCKVMDVDISYENSDDIVIEGIKRLEKFYKKFELPTRLNELNIDDENFEKMSKKAVQFGEIGQFKRLNANDILQIYKLALE